MSYQIKWLLILIKNIFSALFYIGERGGANSLISAFHLSPSRKKSMRPEDLRGYTMMFAVFKCILYFLPDIFLLSRTTSSGVIMPSPLSRYYPLTLLLALILGTVIGAIWLARSKAYIRAAVTEGKFADALNFLSRADSERKFENKVKLRQISNALLFLILASFSSFKISLQETEQINLLPGFIHGILLLICLTKLSGHANTTGKPTLIAGASYSAVACIHFTLSVIFLNKYDYIDIATNGKALSDYIPIVVFAILEFIAYIILIVVAVKLLHKFITANTGVSPDSERYGKTELSYHNELKKKCNILFGIGLFAALAKCVDVILYSGSKYFYSDLNGSTVTVTSSAIPWFSLIPFCASIVFVGFAFYFCNIIKEECKIKYSMQQ